MEFVRKTIVGFALVVGGLYTAHSIAKDAMKNLMPQSATFTVSRVPEVDGANTTDSGTDSTYGHQQIIHRSAKRIEPRGALNSPASESSPPIGDRTPSKSPLIESQSSDDGDSPAHVATSDNSPGLVGLLTQDLSAVSTILFRSHAIQLLVAILGSSLISGASVYRLYPWLERRKTARQQRAALRRRSQAQRDEELLAALDGKSSWKTAPPLGNGKD